MRNFFPLKTPAYAQRVKNGEVCYPEMVMWLWQVEYKHGVDEEKAKHKQNEII